MSSELVDAILRHQPPLPLTALECFRELALVCGRQEMRLLGLAKRCAATSGLEEQHSAGSSGVAFEDVLPVLISKYLRDGGHKVAALAVEEALGTSSSRSQKIEGSVLGTVSLAALWSHFTMCGHPQTGDGAVPGSDAASNSTSIAKSSSDAVATIDALQKRILELENQVLELQSSARAERMPDADAEEHLPLVECLADRLPTIIDSVHSTKKECLIPVILSVIEHHPAQQLRSSLAFYLLNLHKRPNFEQRLSIVEGLTELGSRLNSSGMGARLDEELVNEVWPLVNHRYPEKRCLALSVISALAPYLCLDSKLLALVNLVSPLSSDASVEVREAAAVSLGSLWPESMDDVGEQRYAEIIRICIRLLVDLRTSVSATMEKHLDRIHFHCYESKTLIMHFAPMILVALNEAVSGSAAPDVASRQALVLVHHLRRVFEYVKARAESDDGRRVIIHRAASERLFPLAFDAVHPNTMGVHYEELFVLLADITSYLGPAFRSSVPDKLFLDRLEAFDDDTLEVEAEGSARSLNGLQQRKLFASALLVHYALLPSSPPVLQLLSSALTKFATGIAWRQPLCVEALVGTIGKLCGGGLQAHLANSAGASNICEAFWLAFDNGDARLRAKLLPLFLHVLTPSSEEVAMRTLWPAVLMLINDHLDEGSAQLERLASNLAGAHSPSPALQSAEDHRRSATPTQQTRQTEDAAIPIHEAIHLATTGRPPEPGESLRLAVQAFGWVVTRISGKDRLAKVVTTFFETIDATGPFSLIASETLQHLKFVIKEAPFSTRDEFLLPQVAALCSLFLQQKTSVRPDVANATLRRLIDIFAVVASSPVPSPPHVKGVALPAIRSLSKTIDSCGDLSLKHSYAAALKDLVAIEASGRPQQPHAMSFFEKMKQEISSMVGKGTN